MKGIAFWLLALALMPSSIAAQTPYYQGHLVRVLVQTGKTRDSRLPDTPLLNELMDQYKTPEDKRRLVSAVLGSGDLGIAPLFGPPGIPAEQVKVLRAAYAKALKNPDLVADARKQGLDPDLIPGDEVESLAKEVMEQPPQVIAAMKKLLGEK
jgi:hypothetical protein